MADLQQSLEYLRAGNITLDGIQQIIINTQICDDVYNTDPFDLAGPGVLLSFAIAATLIVLFGTIQSFISYVIPPYASSTTRLAIARAQILYDTTCNTAFFLFLVTLITSYFRLQQSPNAYECIMIQRLLDTQSTLITLALIARIIQKRPVNLRPSTRRWGLGQIWTLTQALIIPAHYVKSMSGKASSAVLSRLCAATQAAHHPTGSLGWPTASIPESGNYYLLFGIGTFVLTVVVCIAVDNIRSRFWSWLKTVFTSRLTRVIAVSVWTLLCLVGLILNTWQLIYLWQTMLDAGSARIPWDFGQIVVVALWLPALYQLLLTGLLCLSLESKPNENDFSWAKGIHNILYFLINELCKYSFRTRIVSANASQTSRMLATRLDWKKTAKKPRKIAKSPNRKTAGRARLSWRSESRRPTASPARERKSPPSLKMLVRVTRRLSDHERQRHGAGDDGKKHQSRDSPVAEAIQVSRAPVIPSCVRT